MTGLKFGLRANLLVQNRKITPNMSLVNTSLNNAQGHRFRLYVTRMGTLVRNASHFVDCEQRLCQLFRMYSKYGDDLGKEEEWEDTSVFEPPNYAVLKTLNVRSRSVLLKLICKVLWSMYRMEWKAIIVNKSRRVCKQLNKNRVIVQPIQDAEVPKVTTDLHNIVPELRPTFRRAIEPCFGLPIDARGHVADIRTYLTILLFCNQICGTF